MKDKCSDCKETIKAGCYLVSKEKKSVALVYRDYCDDVSFPKGHVENGESLQECAVRETAEEVKRVAKIVDEIEPTIERYITPRGESCVCYMYVAIDMGHSDNDSTETHDMLWVKIDNVEKHLSYEGLKKHWNTVKDKVKRLCDC